MICCLGKYTILQNLIHLLIYILNLFYINSENSITAGDSEKEWAIGRAVFYNADKTLLIWVNEKDHLRISSMIQGIGIIETFDKLCRAANEIEKVCKFAHDQHLGYLTSCPTNLGTALLASVLISLPKLKKNREMFEIIAD